MSWPAGKASKAGKTPDPELQDPAAKQRIAKMFSMAARRSTTVKNDAATTESADALLDDILGDLGGPDTKIKAHTPPVRAQPPAARYRLCAAAAHGSALAVRI